MSRPLEFPNDSKRARDLLDLLLPTAADSDAFLIDCFPAVRKRMQPLSDRKAMLNLLLELVEPRDVLSKLYRYVEDDPSKRAMLQAFLANAPLHEESAELSGQLQRMMEERDEARRRGQDVRALDQRICELKSRRRPKSPALEQDVLLAGRYKLKEPIGRGGYARVWLAWDKWLECLVVLRVLHSDWRDDPERQARFLRGAKWMQKLSHPHIARVLGEPGEDDGYHFFALEYLEKKSLDIALPHGELSREQALEVVFQVGEALQYMHSYGVVHRDVKPANILIDDRCCARLTDFDAIYVEDSPDSHLGTGSTLIYASPEALDEKTADERIDLYSLAMTAVFVLHGRQPDASALRDPGHFIDGLACNGAVKQVLRIATAVKPSDRYTSVAEFCASLRAALAVEETPPPMAAAPSPTRWAGLGQTRWLAPGAFTLGLVLLVLGLMRPWAGPPLPGPRPPQAAPVAPAPPPSAPPTTPPVLPPNIGPTDAPVLEHKSPTPAVSDPKSGGRRKPRPAVTPTRNPSNPGPGTPPQTGSPGEAVDDRPPAML